MQQITSTDYSAGAGSKSIINNTKNELVVSRNHHHRTMTLQRSIADILVMGRQDEKVGSSGNREDSGGYRRLVDIEGGVYTRPVKGKSMTFYFVCPSSSVSVSDTSKCS